MVKLKALKQLPWTNLGLSFLALLILFPNPYHTVAELDASWQAVLEHAFFNHWQFGKDIIFTGGPFSFLYSPTSIGYFPKTQVFLEATVLFFAILSIFHVIKRERFWIRALVFLCIVCAAVTSRDSIYITSVMAIALGILKSQKDFRFLILPIVFVAILGLMKFTMGMLGGFCLVLVSGLKSWERDHKQAYRILGTYLGSVFLIWMVIGQSPLNILSYLHHSWSLSQGYAWAMHLQEPQGIFKYLLLILLLTSLPIFIWTLLRRDKVSWAILFISAISVYLFWKTGITRYGPHVFFFIQGAALVPVLVLPFVRKKRLAYIWIGSCFLLFFWSNFWLLPTNSNQLKDRVIAQATFGLKFIISAGNEVRKFSDLVPMVKMSHTLHTIKNRIGEESVDVLFYRHGILLLNELNYVPRPTIQNYAAYNDHLTKWNLRHIQENPPQFLLSKDGGVDSRYPTTADNLFLREVFENYSPVLSEEGWLLLERMTAPILFSETEVYSNDKVRFGEEIDVSSLSGHPLWLKVEYEPSMFHNLTSILYKPEILVMKVTTVSGNSNAYRLIGKNLKNGFLLNPTLDSNESIESFLKTNKGKDRIASISIHSWPGLNPFPTTEFGIELIELNRNL